MAQLDRRLPQNVPGPFYVDESCIDCETCMIVAPGTFAESAANLAYVHRQPETAAERHRARMALVACPTSSIGAAPGGGGSAAETALAARAFPEPVAGAGGEHGAYGEIFYCGYASESSFGASSYLIRRPAGNVLIDSPRAAGPLLDRIAELGGVRYLFLTHRDDVADHRQLRERFGCERILHQDDVTPDTAEVERRLTGAEAISLAPDLLVIPVPGHTRGSAALLHGDTLFTGDHLWANPDGRLGASRSVCWYSWDEQVRSLERLLTVPFRRILPGHGRRFEADSVAAAHHALREVIARARRHG